MRNHPPPSHSEAEGPTFTDATPQNLVKAREEAMTTPPPEESEQTIATPPSDNTSTEGALEDPSIPKETSSQRGFPHQLPH